MEQIIYKTYEEWLKQGYQVLKGSKCIYIDDLAKFRRDQVKSKDELFLMQIYNECCDPNL